MTKSRNINRTKWRPTEADHELMRAKFPITRSEEIAAELGVQYHQVVSLAKRMGLKKSEAFFKSEAAGRLLPGGQRGASSRFAPGMQPWNTGKKMPGHGNPEHWFKQGHTGGRREAPVGSYRVNKDGYAEIKLCRDPGPYFVRWKPVHRYVWEQTNGPIPDGHIVVFRPGRRTTDPTLITIDALECITHADHMRRHSFHQYGPEIAHVTQLRGALSRQINRKAKEAA